MCRLADDCSQFTGLPPQGQVSIPALPEDWKFDINQDKTRVQWPKNLKCPGIQKIVANINFREIGGKQENKHDSPNWPLYYVLVVVVDPWVPLSPAFHIYQHYILLHIIFYVIFCYISYIIWYSATSTIYQLKLCHWDWVMLFVQHIAKSTSMKFLCVLRERSYMHTTQIQIQIQIHMQI